jgi:hypothetical protein
MLSLFLHDAWKVLVYSVVLGAGLPVVYALGVRSLTLASHGSETAGQKGERHPVGVALATVCFVVVLAGVAVGLLYVVAAGKGEMLSFDHGYPTMVPKS